MLQQYVSAEIYKFLKSKVTNLPNQYFNIGNEINRAIIFIPQQVEKRYYGDIIQYKFDIKYLFTKEQQQQQINILNDMLKVLVSDDFKKLKISNYIMYNFNINSVFSPVFNDIQLLLEGFGDTYQSYSFTLEIHLLKEKGNIENETK